MLPFVTGDPLYAKARWYAKFLRGVDVAFVSYRDHMLRLRNRADQIVASITINEIANIGLIRSAFSNELIVTTKNRRRWRCRALRKKEAREIRQAVIEHHRTKAAEPRARELALQIEVADQGIADLLSGKKYLRRSELESSTLRSDVQRLIGRCDRDVRLCFNEITRSALQRLSDRVGGKMEEARLTANRQYVKRAASIVTDTTERILHARLTEEQAVAVATDEDVTLVLAGAGTGKTAVITGKTAHLIRDQGAAPGEILVLAFNRRAAEEIRARLPGDVRGVDVRTFHSFGVHVLAQSRDKKPTISQIAEGRQRKNAINEILDEMLNSSHNRDLVKLLAYHRNQYQSPFDFKSADEYFRYVQSTERLTLSGIPVKSLEEVQVANFLSLRGVDFTYEKPYQVDTASARYRQYHPDFYLPRQNIYIEHFALDEQGNPPRHFRNYQEGVKWKRAIHEQHGTTLIETYSWQCRKGVLQSELEKNLRHFGVELSPVPVAELLERLRLLQRILG